MGDTTLCCCFSLGVRDALARQWELSHSFTLSLSCFHVLGDLIQWHRLKNEKIQRKISDFFFLPDQVLLWVQLVGSAQGKGTRCFSNWGLKPETYFLAIFILRLKGRTQWWQSPCPKENDGKAFSVVCPTLWKLLPLVQGAQIHWWASALLEVGLE